MSYVLLVDDEPFVRTLYHAILDRQHKLRVVQADNGKSALEQIAKETPALVLTDVQMPEMNGLELLTNIRKSNQTIPIVIGSGTWTLEEMHRAEKSGANVIYSKGDISPLKVCEIVANCLNPEYIC